MILNNVTKFPIVIIGPPRGGTGAICRQIGVELNIKHFNDITYATDKTELDKFVEYIKTTDNYVVKFHSFDIHKYPDWLVQRIYENTTFNVKIIRSNVTKQIASAYIAQMRGMYTYDSINTDGYNAALPINMDVMKACIKRITEANLELESMDVKFDSIVDYETCSHNNFQTIRTPHPSNYESILKLITVLL